MTLRYSNAVGFFHDFNTAPLFVHQNSSSIILSTDYSSSSVQELIKLKTADHISSFDSLMNGFWVEMVKIKILKSKLFFENFFP